MSGEIDDSDEETYSAIRTVLGSTKRTARWHLTDEVDVLTALGRSNFDLRLVETTGRPVAEISVTCILGTVSLVVPPGTLVVLDGTSFLARAASEVEPGDVSSLPRIEVTATTVLGRVKIVSREVEGAIVADTEVAAAAVADHEPAPTPAPTPPPTTTEPIEHPTEHPTDDSTDDAGGTAAEPAEADAAPLAS